MCQDPANYTTNRSCKLASVGTPPKKGSYQTGSVTSAASLNPGRCHQRAAFPHHVGLESLPCSCLPKASYAAPTRIKATLSSTGNSGKHHLQYQPVPMKINTTRILPLSQSLCIHAFRLALTRRNSVSIINELQDPLKKRDHMLLKQLGTCLHCRLCKVSATSTGLSCFRAC